LAFFIFSLLFCWPGFAVEDEGILLKKSQLLVQKGIKAEERGEIEDAVASYEEAYQVYPKNILPLLRWGKALCRVGMFDRAAELLKQIPVDKLPAAGQSEVHLLNGKIAVAKGSLEEAASAFSFSLKAHDKNDIARIRLAMVNLLLGIESRAEELLGDYEAFHALPMRDLVIAMMADLHGGSLGRAYATAGEIADLMGRSSYEDYQEPFLRSLWQIQPITFLTMLPLGLGSIYGLIYFVVVFSGLVFLATRLSPPTPVWHSIVFVVLAVAMLLGGQLMVKKDLMLAIMQDDYSANDGVWIIPRLLISGHFVALAMFLIFPCFNFLPGELRPRRYELYGIWFFCWCFIIFVLVFQSRLGFGTRAAYMAVSLLLAGITSFFMPLGRFVLYRIMNTFGFGGFAEVSRQQLKDRSSISFTDAKILETKTWKLIEKDEYEEVVLIARKVLGSLDRKNFPSIWKAMIFALIMREDFLEAQKHVSDFLEIFKGSSMFESGQLFEALLKSRKGDFAGALKIIRALPDDRVKGFSADETALCLLILGRCDLAYKENVQAHIDLAKAFNCARLPIIKSDALVEIAELDFNMNSKDALAKWKARVNEIGGGAKSQANRQIVLSIVARSEGDNSAALQLAQQACDGSGGHSRAFAWYGHLLCLSGQQNEAEALLQKMAPDSVDATRLMTEVTA
jgi:tetratricopeptide (TPR) repeat protein